MSCVQGSGVPSAEIPFTAMPDGSVLVKCQFCDGKGAKYADGSGLCPGCNGSGVHRLAPAREAVVV